MGLPAGGGGAARPDSSRPAACQRRLSPTGSGCEVETSPTVFCARTHTCTHMGTCARTCTQEAVPTPSTLCTCSHIPCLYTCPHTHTHVHTRTRYSLLARVCAQHSGAHTYSLSNAHAHVPTALSGMRVSHSETATSPHGTQGRETPSCTVTIASVWLEAQQQTHLAISNTDEEREALWPRAKRGGQGVSARTQGLLAG